MGLKEEVPNNLTEFWGNSSVYRDRFKILWREIAMRYKDEETVGGYDLINEPCPDSMESYRALIKETIETIRSVDGNHLINIEEPFCLGESVVIFPEIDNLIYDFHFYSPWSEFTNSSTSTYGEDGSGVEITKEEVRELYYQSANPYIERGVPFQVTEFGQKYSNFLIKGSNKWVEDLYGLFQESNSSGYFYFSYKGNEFSLYQGGSLYYENSTINLDLKEIFQGNN